ncbi:dicarboxylate/amino acid:cation symporter [Vallitalea okinawensis]|uniref:dicarboxylate/amino acid:cation symporter n=1 Tax=Vallitalea okinawensis TaxID=2078660 RepID=UPI000CFB9C80|nr:dicarboxylate/amino acid:cation symporter [Vallitalea okinawensis]
MKKKIGLLPKLIIGIIVGIIIGLVCSQLDNYVLIKVMNTFAATFGNFLKFMVPIVILGFVIPGIAHLGDSAGKLLGITAGIAYVSAITAGFIAYALGIAILPSFISAGAIAQGGEIDLSPYFEIGMAPVMGVMTALVLAFILGIGIARNKAEALNDVINDFQKIVAGVVRVILIPFIPFYIATIFAKLTATGEIFSTMSSFAIVFVLILGLQLSYIIIQYLISFLVTKKNPVKSIKNMLPAYFTALGTQSSAATIPVTIQCASKNEVSEDIVDFVIPLGATIHLAGDTITLVLAAMGVMMIGGEMPTLQQMIPYIFMLGITMVAAPGIPGGGVVAALGLMEKMLFFGPEQQALMIALHFAQDSFGTATNVTGDGAIAIVVDKIASWTKKEKAKKA